MIEILPPLGKHKYDIWRILRVKCYIDNSVHLRSWAYETSTNISGAAVGEEASIFYLSIDYMG
jgi:hypothetical protein